VNRYLALVVLFAAIAVLTVMTTASAYAQQLVAPSAAPPPNSKCGESSLTQEKFLNMVHEIAMHGDLTDVAFIEKRLQLKFTPEIRSGYVEERYKDNHSYMAFTSLFSYTGRTVHRFQLSK